MSFQEPRYEFKMVAVDFTDHDYAIIYGNQARYDGGVITSLR
eukprot:SAG22_NODE_29_length_28404_cov_23.294153_11_plen_42_part_00